MIKDLISFIIIEYHSLDDVMICVHALKQKCINLEYEIVVSSNSMYSVNKQKEITKLYPEIVWQFNKKNGGFAFGMNRGIEACIGEFVVLQNPDTTVTNENLQGAIEYLKKNEEVGILGPQIVNNAGEIQDTCRPFLTPGKILSRFVKRKISKKGAITEKNFDYTKIQNVNWVIGAYMITTKKALNKVGLLNERFFMYVEDMEWCLRFWEKELRVVYYPNLVIKYEGDRKSTSAKSRLLPISINKYTLFHLKNYLIFLNDHGLRKIVRLKKLHSA